MPSITSANAANAIAKLVAAQALPVLVSNLVMGNIVNRNYEADLAQHGDTVNIPIPPTMVANNIAEGGTVTTQNPSLGNAQIVLNTHAEASFVIPDVTKALASVDLMTLYMKPACVAIAEKIETDLLSLYAQFTGNSTVGLAGTALTEATVDSAETTLFTAKVPSGEPKYLIVDAAGYSALRQVQRFSEYRTAGDAGLQALINGNIGKLKDMWVLRSQNVLKTGSSPATTHNLAIAPSAMGLAIRKLGSPIPGTGAISETVEMGSFGLRVTMAYKPDTLGQQFTVDVLYGTAVLRNKWGVQVES